MRTIQTLLFFAIILSAVALYHPSAIPSSGAVLAQGKEARASLGGDIAAARYIVDPHPAFNGIALDTQNNVVVMSDTNRKSVLLYDRTTAASRSGETTLPLGQVIGPATNIGFVAGVAVDPVHREFFAVNNDIEDTLVAFPYDAAGNAGPLRLLSVPHQAWGLALGLAHDEIATTVEVQSAIVFYRREAKGLEPPTRYIRGPQTRLADPHGLYWDEVHKEIAVANHGNFRGLAKDLGLGCMDTTGLPADAPAGEFRPPSVTIYSDSAKGDARPIRVIQGPHTRLDWPMGIAVDSEHDEIVVANNGDDSILIFRRTANGDVAPLRVLHGERTGVNRPMGVAADSKNSEIWVANFGDHTAAVFPRDAQGNQPPKRTIRNAPQGTPCAGFGNPMAVGYDSKRGEILVPN